MTGIRLQSKRATARRGRLSAAIVLALLAPTGQAHHSLGAVYDDTQRRTVDGIVTEFRFVHPHPMLFILSVDEDDERSWQLEMDNRLELSAIGITHETFRPGDRVVVTGSVGRTDRSRLYLYRLERSEDGLLYEQRGSTPMIVFGDRRP